jgi:hypothetical protein
MQTMIARTIENKALVLDLLEWLSDEPRPYTEVMDAWRTSCPRLTIWEDAVDLRLVARSPGGLVRITDEGRAFLRSERHPAP